MWLGSPAKDTPDLPPPNEPASGGGPFGSRPRLQVSPAAQSGSREKKPAQSPACWPTGRGAGGSWPAPAGKPRPRLRPASPWEEEPAAPSQVPPVSPPHPAAGPNWRGPWRPAPSPPLRPAPRKIQPPPTCCLRARLGPL